MKRKMTVRQNLVHFLTPACFWRCRTLWGGGGEGREGGGYFNSYTLRGALPFNRFTRLLYQSRENVMLDKLDQLVWLRWTWAFSDVERIRLAPFWRIVFGTVNNRIELNSGINIRSNSNTFFWWKQVNLLNEVKQTNSHLLGNECHFDEVASVCIYEK